MQNWIFGSCGQTYLRRRKILKFINYYHTIISTVLLKIDQQYSVLSGLPWNHFALEPKITTSKSWKQSKR